VALGNNKRNRYGTKITAGRSFKFPIWPVILWTLIGGFVGTSLVESEKEISLRPDVLSDKTKESLGSAYEEQIAELKKIFGKRVPTSGIGLYSTKYNIEPKEIVLYMTLYRGRINLQTLPDYWVPVYNKINAANTSELESIINAVRKIKSFEQKLTDPAQKKDWLEFRQERERRVNEKVKEIQSRLMKQRPIKELVLRDRARRYNETLKGPKTGRLASVDRTRFRPQHRI